MLDEMCNRGNDGYEYQHRFENQVLPQKKVGRTQGWWLSDALFAFF